jgi:hypothetical protein
VGVSKFVLEPADAIRRSGQGDDAKSSGRETPDNRRPGAGADTCHDRNWLVSHGGGLARTHIVGTRFEAALAHPASVVIAAMLDDYRHTKQRHSAVVYSVESA